MKDTGNKAFRFHQGHFIIKLAFKKKKKNQINN